MTRTEAIAVITASLAKLDDARVADLAELVQSSTEPATRFRSLSDEERAGLERARQDFVSGRTLSQDEYRADIDDFMAKLDAKHPKSA